MTHQIDLLDVPGSRTINHVAGEIVGGLYDPHKWPLHEGAVMFDLGANIGSTCITYALLFPSATIYAYEPVQETFELLCRNIEANGATNVHPRRLAVTGDGREVLLSGLLDANSGGMSMFCGEKHVFPRVAPSMRLRDIMHREGVRHIDLLKMDIEGAEHEVVAGDPWVFDYVARAVGELHINDTLRAAGYTNEKTWGMLSARFPFGGLKMQAIEMCA